MIQKHRGVFGFFITMNYNVQNAHPRDTRIEFDSPSHTYTVTTEDGSRIECESVTTVVERLFAQFDADYWAERKATPERPASVIKAEWARKGEIARELGTQMHDLIERYYLGHQPSEEALKDVAFRYFLDFSRCVPLVPYRTEWRIFSEKYRIAGTLDFLGFKDEVFEIYDWKRSCKLVDRQGHVMRDDPYGKHGKFPIEHIPDTVFYHYAIQVSLYRFILEEEYGIHAVAGNLGTFHPENPCHYVIKLPYLRDEAEAILHSRL